MSHLPTPFVPVDHARPGAVNPGGPPRARTVLQALPRTTWTSSPALGLWVVGLLRWPAGREAPSLERPPAVGFLPFRFSQTCFWPRASPLPSAPLIVPGPFPRNSHRRCYGGTSGGRDRGLKSAAGKPLSARPGAKATREPTSPAMREALPPREKLGFRAPCVRRAHPAADRETRQLAAERKQLEYARRRGRLAGAPVPIPL